MIIDTWPKTFILLLQEEETSGVRGTCDQSLPKGFLNIVLYGLCFGRRGEKPVNEAEQPLAGDQSHSPMGDEEGDKLLSWG